MENTSDMNTPEHATVNSDSKEYIDKLQTQLIQHQIQRAQGRDYAKILREHNTPAQWYKNQSSTMARSIYYYDPNYQKYRQQQQQHPSKSSMNVRFLPPTSRATNQSKSRTKYSVHYSHNHQQKLPSRLQSIPILPPIMIQKRANEE